MPGSTKEEPTSAGEPAKEAGPEAAKADQELKQPLLAKVPSATGPVVLGQRPTVSGLPAFRLNPEGLGGVRLAVVWVA